MSILDPNHIKEWKDLSPSLTIFGHNPEDFTKDELIAILHRMECDHRRDMEQMENYLSFTRELEELGK